MSQNNLITDLFLYFARFPKREGIYPMFNTGTSSVPGYAELRQSINELSEHSLTDIKNYVFGTNLEAVLQRVNNINAGEDFLFVDFGEIDCNKDTSNRMTDSARIAINVAYRARNFSIDLIEQALAFSRTFDSLIAIRNKMFAEQRCIPWLKHISDEHSLVPFVSKEMGSVGWTMIFSRESFDSFRAKK
jgi:hypothetical protein